MERFTGTAGETLTAYDLCYLKSDGKYWKTDADAATTMPGVALASSAMAADEIGIFIRNGIVNNSGWSWATLGGYLYADNTTAGAIVQTAPSDSGDQVQIIGVAITATQINFDPQLILVEVA